MSFAQMVKKNLNTAPKVNVRNVKVSVNEVKEVAPQKSEDNFPSLTPTKTESTTTEIPLVLSDKTETKKFKMSDTTYQKKLEKKASKKAEKEANKETIVQKQRELEQKATTYAQKAYDDEYTIAFIEESRKAKAIERAQKAYEKAYTLEFDALRAAQKAYDVAFSSTSDAQLAKKAYDKEYKETYDSVKKKNLAQTTPTTPTPIVEEYILDDSESEDELPPLEQAPFTEQKIVEVIQMNQDNTDDSFQIVKRKHHFKQNQFAKKLETSKHEYVNTILSDKLLLEIEENFKKNKSMVISLKTTDDILQSGDNYTITKTGFLKNKMFSKFLSGVIFKKLNNLRLYVDITKVTDESFNVTLTEKASITA